MMETIYTFNGKDITMNICVLPFEEATGLFYNSQTYKTLQNTENALWAESPEYIADQYFAESK